MPPKFLKKIVKKFTGKGKGPKTVIPQTSAVAQQVVQNSRLTTDTAPSILGFTLVWSDDFNGPAGTAVNANNWLSYTGPVYNNEIERYTSSTANAQLSGFGQVYIIPLKDNTGAWTSARLHGKSSFACDP